MKSSDESTGPAGRDVVSAEPSSARADSKGLSFPVFNHLRQQRQEKATLKAIPDAEFLNDSGMRGIQD